MKYTHIVRNDTKIIPTERNSFRYDLKPFEINTVRIKDQNI